MDFSVTTAHHPIREVNVVITISVRTEHKEFP